MKTLRISSKRNGREKKILNLQNRLRLKKLEQMRMTQDLIAKIKYRNEKR